MKKLLFRGLVLTAIFTATSCSDEPSVWNDSEQLSMNNIESCVDQSKALEAFADLKDYYGVSTKNLQDSGEIICFPDYYGGSYLDGNKLVVYVQEGANDLPSILTENSNIILKESKFSFNYLSEVLNNMNQIYSASSANLNPVIENIDMFALSETNNRIEVYLKDCSSTEISNFKNYMVDSPAIVFIQSESQNEEFTIFMDNLNSAMRVTYTVNPGSQLGAAKDLNASQTPGSLGYKATYKGKTGFVTAAHVASLKDTIFTIYDTNKANPIAVCTLSEKSGSVDIAFCELTEDDCNVTNKIRGNASKVLTQEIFKDSDIKEGLKVSLAGYQTESSGVIEHTTTSSGGLINLIAATYSSTNGDSGGLVYCVNGGKYYIIGVHRARTTYGLSSNIHYINELGISPSK